MHIFATFQFKNDDPKLQDMEGFIASLNTIIASAGVKDLGKVAHKFDGGGGFTVITCLAESHIALHTWPELNNLTLDVYLCNYLHENTAKCQALYDGMESYFEPEAKSVTKILR